jgi:hypothetical protein
MGSWGSLMRIKFGALSTKGDPLEAIDHWCHGRHFAPKSKKQSLFDVPLGYRERGRLGDGRAWETPGRAG